MNRRSILIGIGSALATPAIVRAESLMKVVMPKRPDIFAMMNPIPPIDRLGFRMAPYANAPVIAGPNYVDFVPSDGVWTPELRKYCAALRRAYDDIDAKLLAKPYTRPIHRLPRIERA